MNNSRVLLTVLKANRSDDYVHLHCNFFINKGKAKSSDIENLIKKVKNKVYEKTKINLELEIKIVGE